MINELLKMLLPAIPIKRRFYDKYAVSTVYNQSKEDYETAIIVDGDVDKVYLVHIGRWKATALLMNWRTYRALKRGIRDFGVIASPSPKVPGMMYPHPPKLTNIDQGRKKISGEKVVSLTDFKG